MGGKPAIWAREFLRLGAGRAARHLAGGKADGDRLVGAHGAPGQKHVHGAALAHDARQADRGAVAHRHAPAAREDAEARRLVDDADVAVKRHAEAAGAGMALDGGDHRLRQRRAQRALVAARPGEVVGAARPAP